MQSISINDFKKAADNNALIIDLRPIQDLKEGFIKGSVLLSNYSGPLDDLQAFSSAAEKSVTILLVGEQATGDKRLDKLRESGIEIKGVLQGGFDSWLKAGEPVDMIIEVLTDELMMDIPFDPNLIVLDLRPAVIFANSHLKDAVNIPLNQITDPLRLAAIEDKDNLYLIGANDAESYFAASVLKKHDIHNLRVVSGGWESVQQEKKAVLVKEPGMLN